MNTRKSNILRLAVAGLAALAFAGGALAQSSDALIDKLVDKGILTVKEANQLREEADKGFNRSYSVKSGMPDWVTTFKINGDLRGRYDQTSLDNGQTARNYDTYVSIKDRERFRYRLRVSMVASMTNNTEVGARFGSGDYNSTLNGGSPVSGNSTMGADDSRKLMFIDQAYAKWTPIKGFDFTMGKMASQFWTTPMVMSPDYNPEGLQEKYTYNAGASNTVSVTAGQFVVDENNYALSSMDPYLLMEQIDWAGKWTQKFSTRLGVATYAIANQESISPSLEQAIGTYNNGSPAAGSPSVAPDGTLLYPQTFTPVIGRAEATYALETFPLYQGEFPVVLGLEYVNNPSADGQFTYTETIKGKTVTKTAPQGYNSRQNEAYSVGVTFGSAKTTGNWQVGYAYKCIQAAALWRGIMDDNFGYATVNKVVPTNPTYTAGDKSLPLDYTTNTINDVGSAAKMNVLGGGNVRGHCVSASYHVLDPLTVGVQAFITEAIINDSSSQGKTIRILVDALWTF